MNAKFTFTAKRLSRAGFTLGEVMVSAVILAIMTLAVMPVIRLSQQGFSSMEARNNLKTEGEAAINRIGQRLAETKRLFENTVADQGFVSKLVMTSTPMATGTFLPILEDTGAISPSSGTFVAAGVGNALLFASVVQPADVTALDASSVSHGVRVDLYVFNGYFLAIDSTAKPIAKQSRRTLKEWHSNNYADYNQIIGVIDATERANAAKAIFAKGVSYAWDPSTGVATAAFYAIDGGSGALTLQPGHTIAQASGGDMIKINTGMTLGGYRWGVCPNTTGLSTADTVPKFGIASSNFPSGFEIVAVGPNSARQVFIRLVLVAEGSFPGTITSEQVLLTTVRDLY